MWKRYAVSRAIMFSLLPLGLAIFHFTASLPTHIEKYYSGGLFKVVAKGLSLLAGWLPFSLGEVLIGLFTLLAVWRIFLLVKNLLGRKPGKKRASAGLLLNVLAIAGVFYFCFLLLWGLNYNRESFSTIAGLDVKPASVDELEMVCADLINRANGLRSLLDEDGRGVMCLSKGKSDAFRRAIKGFEEAARIYPELGGRYSNPKGIKLSIVMAYTGLAGVYFPFTGEANVNVLMPDPFIPSTACHEMAHQRGFAREDEANYIAYLACSLHPDTDFQYSGVLLALVNTMNALYESASDRYYELMAHYSAGVLRDLRANNEFWVRYEGPIERMANSANDAYLKANRQKEGVGSYGRMVDLLIAEYRARNR